MLDQVSSETIARDPNQSVDLVRTMSMEPIRNVRLASFQADQTALEEREKALVYLTQRSCPGNREEAELELRRVRNAIRSAHAGSTGLRHSQDG